MALDVSMLPLADQFAAWAVMLHPFQAETAMSELGFDASTEAWFLSSVIISWARLGPMRVWRAPDSLHRDGLDGLTFQLFLSGSMNGIAAGRCFEVTAGDVVMQDASQPWDCTATRSETIAINLPRAFLDDVLPDFDVHGVVLRNGLATALAALIGTLPAMLSASTREEVVELPRLLRDLLAAVLRQSVALDPSDVARDKLLRGRIRRYVGRNLNRPIGAPEICDALGQSRTGVYRALQPDGGVAKFIQQLRLAKVRRLLGNPHETRPMATLARDFGFNDMSHFNRVFRQRFGITPGALRHHMPPSPIEPGSTMQESFLKWVDRLDR
ncbi:MAG: helix-turn-helix domain-containing protein [Janthinobacterium lividum]